MKYNIKGYPRSYKTTFIQNHSSTFVYGPILLKISMNANIIYTQFFYKFYDLKSHFYVMEKLCDF